MTDMPLTAQLIDDVESCVAAAWRTVLGRPPSGQSSFFEEGGDSLLATRLVSRLNAQLGVALTPRDVFEATTLRELIAVVRGRPVHGTNAVEEPPDSALALSFSQERMWFMHALAADSAAYHIPLALRLRGRLDRRCLVDALQQLVDRHIALRTTFPTADATPQLRVHRSAPVSVSQVQLDAGEAQDRSALNRCLSRLTAEPFDLERGPLVRFALVTLQDDDFVLLIVMHHIVGDQWTWDVVIRELADLYAASTRATATSLAAPPDYTRYAAWHRKWFTTSRMSIELEYWRRQLANLEPVAFTGDHPRPPHPSFRGAKVRVPLERHDVERLKEIGASRRASLAMVLLAALNILLYRHTGRTDIAIGVPIANRHHPGSENLVGVLVNTLVARTRVASQQTFTEVLDHVRGMMLDAFDHQDMPFELLVRELALSRNANRSPLFSVMFNMLNTPRAVVDLGGIACSRLDFDKHASQFDLTVTIDPTDDYSIYFEYSTDLFARETVERLAGHYMRILASVARGSAETIARLPLLSQHELQLLVKWGTGPSLQAPGTTVTGLLEQSFRRARSSVALRSIGCTFTYERLDGAIDSVARQLKSRRLGRGARVGLCLWRSPLTVISQIAVLRAGAAYVPLDSSYPAERLAYIARDSGLRAVLTEAPLMPILKRANIDAELLDVEDWLRNAGSSVETQSSNETLAPDATPDDPAYVIYTSGSTGRPKGVEVPHKAVVNFLRSMVSVPGISPADRLLAVTTLSFDISVLELLLPLTVGGEVIIASREQLSDGAVLGRLIESSGATLMQATPSMWRMLLDSGWNGSARLRALVGGETLDRQLASELLERCSEVWNMYGPTETTVWSTCWKVERSSLDCISIGSPIANTWVCVLDANLQLVPIGAAGELFIGGDGVANGYVNHPDLTEARFLLRPGQSGSRRRLYRTGDRARWRHDGTLEHLGRLDSQVKIRGYRIELGEIEARLAEHPDVTGVVARIAEDERGDACIVAYVVPRADMPEPGVFRQHLQQWLPSHMLPQYFVELDAMPLLASGKIDRVSLANASTEVRKRRATVPPGDDRELAIHGVWAALLGTDKFGVHESFFDLGGHSLLAVQVAARVSRKLGRPCALPMIFRYPTVSSLAAAMAAQERVGDDRSAVLQSSGNGPPVFCISGVDLYHPFADRSVGRSPVYGLFSAVEADYWGGADELLLSPVRDLAADYVATISARHPLGPYVIVGFSFGGVIAFEIAQRLTSKGMQVALLAILDSDPPMLDGPGTNRRTATGESVRTGARALFDLGRRFGGAALHGAGKADATALRRRRYMKAMRQYRARPYAGRSFLVETGEQRLYDPGHGWDSILTDLKVCSLPSAGHGDVFKSPHVDAWTEEMYSILSHNLA